MKYYCLDCDREISQGVYDFSMKNFGKPLCMTHQPKIKHSTETTHTSYPKQKQVDDDDFDIDLIAVSKKVLKGASKIIKERSIIGEGDLNKWISNWGRDRRGFDFSMDSRHFFLGGSDLDDFTKQIIKGAKSIILVSNPYIETCYITQDLEEARKREVEIKIVHRPESNNYKRVETQKRLRKSGIILHSDERIHSKILVVDDKVAIVSSMNYYPGSSAGASDEAGIVTIDEKVVDSAANYIRKFFE
jgi:hypothetical protein